MPQGSVWSSKHFGRSSSPRHVPSGPSFLPHDKLPCGCKVFQYTLTVVQVASCYKEAEPITSKESAEVAKAFQKIYKHGTLKWPQLLQVDSEKSSWALFPKKWKTKKFVFGARALTFTETKPALKDSTAPWLSACSDISLPSRCSCHLASGRLHGWLGCPKFFSALNNKVTSLTGK